MFLFKFDNDFSTISSYPSLFQWQLLGLLDFERVSFAIARESFCDYVFYYSSIQWLDDQPEIIPIFCKLGIHPPFFCELALIKHFNTLTIFSYVVFDINATICLAWAPNLVLFHIVAPLQSFFLIFCYLGGEKVLSRVSNSNFVLLSKVANGNVVSSITNSA